MDVIKDLNNQTQAPPVEPKVLTHKLHLHIWFGFFQGRVKRYLNEKDIQLVSRKVPLSLEKES